MIFLLVRHGETAHNLLGARGVVGNNALLNENGVRQATNAATIIKPFQPSQIFTSVFQRCVQTAEIISQQTNAPIIQASALKEFDMGEWSKLKSEETKRLLQKNNAWDYSPEKFTFRVPGGESWEDVSRRVENFIGKVKSSRPNDSTLVVVSHNATLRAFVGIMRNLPFKDWFGFPFPNAAISVFESKANTYEELFVNRVN